MLVDPGLDVGLLTDALRTGYGIQPSTLTFVPSHDAEAASYEVGDVARRWFAKVRFGAVSDIALEVPRALLERGVENVLAPLRSIDGRLAWEMGEATLVLYPFVAGRSARDGGMTAALWRAFGTSLRAVHDSGLEQRFADTLPTETFALRSAAEVAEVVRAADATRTTAALRLRRLLEGEETRIGAMLERAKELGARLVRRSGERVLCHADIHAANLLIANDGRVFMVDWDGPMLAPRERDLLFVIGSRIARRVEPREEAWFFQGYGDVEVDADAIVYFRLERILEDIGEFGRTILRPAPGGDPDAEVTLIESFFEPGGVVDTVEEVRLRR